jgi:Methylmalonyl Co-A mutase-associated GTPase MeaB
LFAGGDELQGVKKGIVEVADCIVVNKCDEPAPVINASGVADVNNGGAGRNTLAAAGRHAATEYRRALGLVRPKHTSLMLPQDPQHRFWLEKHYSELLARLQHPAALPSAVRSDPSPVTATVSGGGSAGMEEESAPSGKDDRVGSGGNSSNANIRAGKYAAHTMSSSPMPGHPPAMPMLVNTSLWTPPVLRVSAHQPTAADGIPALWDACERFWRTLGGVGMLAHRRRTQAAAWMWQDLERELVAAGRRSAAVAKAAEALTPQLAAGHMTPRRAGRALFASFIQEVSTEAASADRRTATST